MPICEHQCKDCGARFEERRELKDTESGKTKCPRCGSTRTGKVFLLFSRAPSSSSCSPSPRRFG